MFKRINLILVLLSLIFIVSCSSDSSALKTIAQQKVGDKVASIMSETDALKKGTGSFYIEFHNASNNDFSDVGKIEANAFMQMTGNPMPGEITVSKTEIPGRYAAKYNFPMAGTWGIVLNFEIVGNLKFSVPVN